ncbi:hypothetical protein [Lysobacter gummosus]|uniref:hypothetical protein n=1 Tax=Lysobacter gummosus TaxID=262324 RepID=UPI003626AFB5
MGLWGRLDAVAHGKLSGHARKARRLAFLSFQAALFRPGQGCHGTDPKPPCGCRRARSGCAAYRRP